MYEMKKAICSRFTFNRLKGITGGFTLLELTIAVSLIAVCAVAAVPAVNSYQRNHGPRYAADQLYGDIQLARMRAARFNRRCLIQFNDPGPNQYALYDVDNNGVILNAGLPFKTVNLRSFRGGVNFVNASPNPVDPAPLQRFQFFPQGIVDQITVLPAGSNAIYLTNQDNNIFYQVFISAAGGVSVDRWIPATNRWG